MKLAEKIKDVFRLDKHTTSAYTLALRYMKLGIFRKLLNKKIQRRLQLT